MGESEWNHAMILNPKIPATRSADGTLKWSAKGLSLNLANSNNWTGAQSFAASATFSYPTYLNGVTYMQGTVYSYTAFYNQGLFETQNFTATGTIYAQAGVTVQQPITAYYDYPNLSSYQLAGFPVTAGSIYGYASDGGSIYDDSLGAIYSSYYGQIATIDYATGYVTDTSYGYVYTTFINYQVAPAGLITFDSSGLASITDGINYVTLCNGSVAGQFSGSGFAVTLCSNSHAGLFTDSGNYQATLANGSSAGMFYNPSMANYTYLGYSSYGVYTEGTIKALGSIESETDVYALASLKAGARALIGEKTTVTTYYEYPYLGSYTLTNTPIEPLSVGGSTSDGGSLYEDGYGALYSSYFGQIATIDYATGVVTDLTSGAVSTNYISYNVSGARNYVEILESGEINLRNSSGSGTGYTGDLNDSTSTKIADVVSGIITAVYF